ncbi:MAG TPA: hypothetical protein VHP83_15140, partial [Aggregatilineaceae bacterium]|nr:hypothetical protein [Aggregatilineaceae bacterium]
LYLCRPVSTNHSVGAGRHFDSSHENSGPIDASALALTPEETEALLDFSPNSPAYEPETSLLTRNVPEVPVQADWVPDWMKEFPETESVEMVEETVDDALPLGERFTTQPPHTDEMPYYPSLEIEELTPTEPELLPKVPETDLVVEAPTAMVPSAIQQHEGGLVVPDNAVVEAAVTPAFDDPFAPVIRRQGSRALFGTTREPDPALLNTLVDDERLKELWKQIDALHEDLISNVQGDRGSTDVYQQELLQASSLLLASRANYDDARAVVYRIRADLNRQRRVEKDVVRYRPLLLNYYLGWVIALGVLIMLKGMFTGVADAVGVTLLSAVYYPMLAGVIGALISGYLTLERHTTKLRDFDPNHTSWYLFNPLLGGAMGLLMFFLTAIANEDLLKETATPLENAIVWLLCVLGGMNQNAVLRQLNDLWKRVGKGKD